MFTKLIQAYPAQGVEEVEPHGTTITLELQSYCPSSCNFIVSQLLFFFILLLMLHFFVYL